MTKKRDREMNPACPICKKEMERIEHGELVCENRICRSKIKIIRRLLGMDTTNQAKK